MIDDAYLQKLKDMNWPQEFHEKLHIGNLKSNVGIATLWTFQEAVYRHLDSNSYAIIGNYYDRKNALEPFIRNCLANPNIRYVILVGNDKAQSREVLVSFFEKGIDESGKIVGTDVSIPRGIALEDIELLRKNVVLIDIVSSITNQNDSEEIARVVKDVITGLEIKGPYSEPKIYEKPVLSTDHYPAESVGYLIRGSTIGKTWLKILNEIYNYGEVTKMKTVDSTQVRECINLIAIIEDEDPDTPVMEPYFRFSESYLKSYYDEICTDKLPEGTTYTYGSRLRSWEGKDEGQNLVKIDQVKDMIDYLKKDTYRKSALALTWIVEHELMHRYLAKDKGSPCIVLVQPNIQDGVLHLTVYIRSNDMFRAWPLNAFGLRKLQKIMASELGVDMGTLTTISCSAHIYQDNWEETKEILGKYFNSTNCFFDPRGYYIISIKQGKIVADHYSPDSQLLKEYSGTFARMINDQINAGQHTIDPYHASYLGEELMKAEIALKAGIEYTQDMPLNFDSKSSCFVDDSCSIDNNNC
ncbi:MAG: thymidylate synthase [Nanoarchaeota archaeon]